MRIYDKKRGYSRWFRQLNEVVSIVIVTAVVIALLYGIVWAVRR